MPLLANVVDVTSTGADVYGAVFALADMCACVGNIVGPILGGFLASSTSTGTAYLVVSGMSLLTLPLLLYGQLGLGRCRGRSALRYSRLPAVHDKAGGISTA